MFESARAVGVTSGRPSGETTELTYVPIIFELQYRPDLFLPRYFGTSFGLGFGMLYYDVTEEAGSVSGLKFSLRPAAALLFRFNGFSREVDRLDDTAGVNSLHLYLRAAYNAQFNGGSGLDLSAWEFGLGLGIEL
jgi:hypothetical protein